MGCLKNTMRSGHRFEDTLAMVIQNYTSHIWRNVRIETLLTANGTTELDIIFCFRGMVFILEAKNVSGIYGNYGDTMWSFVGSKHPNSEVREYSNLNVITQNNIHVRSFKDAFYSYFGDWPIVVPIVVVPNECRVSPDIAGSIYTLGQLDEFLREASSWTYTSSVHRLLGGLIGGDNCVVTRPDFIHSDASVVKDTRYRVVGGVTDG